MACVLGGKIAHGSYRPDYVHSPVWTVREKVFSASSNYLLLYPVQSLKLKRAGPLFARNSTTHQLARKQNLQTKNPNLKPLFFLAGARCLSAGHHLRLTRGPAGSRTTTGSLSASPRTTPYQLSRGDTSPTLNLSK